MKWIGICLLLLVAIVLLIGVFGGADQDPPGPDRADLPSPECDPDVAVGETTIPADSACVFGTVRLAGQPVVGRVEARLLCAATEDHGEFAWPWGTGPALATAITDEAGRFEITGLPEGSIALRTVADDGAIGRVTAWIPNAGLRVRADLAIPSGPHSFSGRAIWADGRAFRGIVSVRADRRNQNAFESVAVETAADGRFTITGLCRGFYVIHTLAAKRPLATSDRRILIPFAGDYELVVDRDLRVWTGRVTAAHDESPIVGARLTVSAYPGSFRTEAETDGEGRFSFRAPRQSVWVEATAPGYLDTDPFSFEKEEEIEFLLERAASVAGVLVSAEDGRPVADVPIFHGSGPSGTVTDEEGRFAIDETVSGHGVVYARGNGWVSPELAQSLKYGDSHEFRWSPLLLPLVPGRTTRVKLTAVRAVRVDGRVVDAAGNPLAGVFVGADDATTGDEVETVSDPEGRFVFDSLIPGVVYTFSSHPPGGATGCAGPLCGDRGEMHEVTIRIPKPRVAILVIRDKATGAPIPNARVRVYGIQPDGRSGRDGRIRLGSFEELPRRLTVEHPDYRPLELNIHEEDLGGEIVVPMEPGAVLSGVVVFPDGSRVEGGSVSVSDGEEMITSGELGFGGAFEIRGLPRGDFEARAAVWQGDRVIHGKVSTAVPAKGVRIVLDDQKEDGEDEEWPEVTVRVLDPDGRSIPTVHLRFTSWGDPDDSWSAGGGYRGSGVETFQFPPEHRLVKATVFDPRSAAGLPLPFGPAFVGPVPASQRVWEIRLPPELAVTGRVVDGDGKGLAGIEVRADARGLEDYDIYEDEAIRSSFTNPDGTFRIGGLGDFEVAITLDTPTSFLPAEPVVVRGGDDGVKIVLRRGSSAVIRVLDTSGSPLPGATVSARNTDRVQRWVGAVADQHGVARLDGLDPETRFTLRADPPEGRDDLHVRVVDNWEPADTEVRIPSGWLVRGVVLTVDGHPVAKAVVQGRAADGNIIEVSTGKSGTFEIGSFPADGAELRARPPSDSELFWEDRWVEVEAGASNVNLVLPPYGDLDLTVVGFTRSGSTHGILTADRGQAHATNRYLTGGRLVYRGLPSDRTYTLFIEPDYKGRTVYARGLSPGPDPVTVELGTGRTIRGSVALPPGTTPSFVSIRGREFNFNSDINADGTFVIRGVPPGPCWVTAFLDKGNDVVTRTLKAKAGDVLEFVFD